MKIDDAIQFAEHFQVFARHFNAVPENALATADAARICRLHHKIGTLACRGLTLSKRAETKLDNMRGAMEALADEYGMIVHFGTGPFPMLYDQHGKHIPIPAI